MTEPGDLGRLLELVQGALGLPVEKREEFLAGACGDNLTLLARARQLLAEELPSGFVEPPEPGTERAFGSSLVGETLGEFRLVEEIDRGGMGVVYRARQAGLERDVAVKVLPSIRRADPVQSERFQREISAASKVRHPALLEVISTGENEELAWYAMPFIRGHDLHAELGAQAIAQVTGRALPPFGTVEYVRKVTEEIAHLAEGLHHAHEAGVIHRDVKPRNILLDATGAMFLTDFGLAHLAGSHTLTGTGAIQGTPHYMSPEQARALSDPITHRTDVYSLSVVLYELLAQRRPYQGADVRDLLKRIGSGTHDHVRRVNTSLHRDLATICEKGMAHYPADRYGSAGELADDLRRYLRSEAVMARPLPLARRAWRRVRRHPVKLAAGAAFVAAGLAAWGSAASARRSATREALVDPLTALVETPELTPRLLAAAHVALGEPGLERLLGEEHQPLLERSRALVDADIGRRLSLIDDGIQMGAGPRLDPRYGDELTLEPDPSKLLDALLLATESAGLYPGHAGLEERARIEGMFPKVSLQVAPSLVSRGPARVTYQRVDQVTATLSAPRALGVTPLEGVRLPPGSYRFTAVTADGGLSEIERDLPFRPDSLDLTFWPRTAAELADRMVLIEPQDDRLPAKADRTFHCHTPAEGLPLPRYWIARQELSNADFLAYLGETGAEPPTKWEQFGLHLDVLPADSGVPEAFDRARWLTLPAVGITYPELRACAEWLGCRVPLHHELEFAQRGPGMRLLPANCNPADPPGSWPVNVEGPRGRADLTVTEGIFEAFDALWPVDDPRGFDGEVNLFHPFGNADEFTSSRVVEELDGQRLATDPGRRICLGGAWRCRPDGLDLSAHYATSCGPNDYDTSSTVRCARSALPR